MGRSPLLTLGPNWGFTIGLLGFAGMVACYYALMLSLANDTTGPHMYISYFGICINLLSLFGGIFKNPGMPQPVIDRILKEQLGKGENAIFSSEDDEEKCLEL